MLLPSTLFSKFKINESNLKIIILSAFAMYFLVLYEVLPSLIFEGQNYLFSLGVPSLAVIFVINRNKLDLKKFSIKNKSNKTKNTDSNSIENLISDSPPDGNSEIEALLAGSAEKSADGNSEIEALLAGSAEKSADGNSEIEALLAGVESNVDETIQNTETNQNTENADTNFMIMEKMEPMENDIQNMKTDFDQFKQDLTNVKEEVEILSTSFENTMTDIKSITTDLNNPLNFMKEDAIKKNIQTINVDELIQNPNDSISIPKSEPVVSEPVVSEPVVSEPVVSEPVVSEPIKNNDESLPEEISLLVDELSQDFIPEQIFELIKIHCKTSKIELHEERLMSIINKKTNSNSEKKFNDFEFQLSPKKSELTILNEEI